MHCPMTVVSNAQGLLKICFILVIHGPLKYKHNHILGSDHFTAISPDHIWNTFLSLNISVSSVQSLSRVWLFATPWTAACQASLSITNRSLLKVSDAIQPSHPLSSPSPPTFFPSIRVFSNESVLHIRWLKYWSFSFSNSPSNKYSGIIYFRTGLSLS